MAASKELILMIIVILFFFASANSHVVRNYQYSPEVDVEALEAFKSSITYDPFDALANWYVGNHVCNWTGVSCHPKKLRVIALNLYDRSLEGTITPHLGNMSFLGVLNLTYNSFSGAIPNELGRLRRLKLLWLNRNNLISSIPKALRACTALTVIDLSINNLTGSIPSDLGQLQKLRVLSLYTNRLAGKVPESLGNCSELEILNLKYNFISGIIPFQLGLLASLQVISAAAQDDSTAGLGDTSSTVIGSIGYIAPEYGIGGRLSLKGDVYSYGILLLETITGKRPTDPVFCSTLQSWVGDAFPDRLLEVIDRDLVEEITQEEEDEHESHDLSETRNAIKGNGIVVWLAKIGMMCSREAWQQRPTMREVEASLEKLVAQIL